MGLADYIGFIAGVLVLGSMIPQIIKSWRTKKTNDLSLLMYSIYITGIISWLSYGILLKSRPIIFANTFALIFASTILYLKLRYG